MVDLVILNIVVVGKWVSLVFKVDIKKLLVKMLWWIYEMCGYYFVFEYVKFFLEVVGVIIDFYVIVDYWWMCMRDCLRLVLNVSFNKDWLVIEELINLSLYYLVRILYIYFF